MNITLYSFSKRKNSTAVPSSEGTTVTCVLKEATSLKNPSFLLEDKPARNINYLKWDNAYYWINDITYETSHLWRISCSMDVLATYRAEIHNTTCFIEYGSGGNSRLVDPRLAKCINASELSETAALPASLIDSNGCVVANVTGLNCSGPVGFLGGTLAAAALREVLNDAFNWYDQVSGFDITSVETAIKSLGNIAFSGNAADNLHNAYWVPMLPTFGAAHNLFLGLYDTGLSCYPLDISETFGTSATVTVPKAPNTYQRNSQYSDYNLYIPFIGNISLSADILADEASITIEFSCAPVTGDFTCLVRTASGKVIGTYGSTLRVEIPLASAGVTPSNVVNSISAASGAIRAGVSAGAEIGGVVGGVVGGVAGATGALLSIEGSSSSVGGLGSIASWQLSRLIKLTCSYWDYSDSYANMSPVIGNPIFKVDTISNHSYVKTGAGSVTSGAYGSSINEINALLSGGIYVE